MSTENTEEPTFPEEDFYEILEISQDAEEKEILEAWRKANKTYRVDRDNIPYEAYIKKKYRQDEKESDDDYDKRIKQEMRNFTAMVINLRKILLDKKKRQEYNEWLNSEGEIEEPEEEGGYFYDGDLRFDKPHGQGTKTWKDGDKYKGEFVLGQMHGEGTFTFDDGRIYIGNLVSNEFCGSGKMTEPNKGKYDGKWLDDKKCGQGTYTWTNGDEYIGAWSDDKQHGYGKKTYSDGRIEEGTWTNGQFQVPAGSHAHSSAATPPGGGSSYTSSGTAFPFYKKKVFIPVYLAIIIFIIISLSSLFKGGDHGNDDSSGEYTAYELSKKEKQPLKELSKTPIAEPKKTPEKTDKRKRIDDFRAKTYREKKLKDTSTTEPVQIPKKTVQKNTTPKGPDKKEYQKEKEIIAEQNPSTASINARRKYLDDIRRQEKKRGFVEAIDRLTGYKNSAEEEKDKNFISSIVIKTIIAGGVAPTNVPEFGMLVSNGLRERHRFSYIGDIVNGKPHGKGAISCPDGASISGNWAYGRLYGSYLLFDKDKKMKVGHAKIETAEQAKNFH